MLADSHPLIVLGNMRWRTPPRLLLAALSLAPLGCSDHALPEFTATPTVEWTATEDLRIGSVDDSASALTRVGRLAVDVEGRIYVSQPVDHTIRVFNAMGDRVGTFGRVGDGPGEFRAVTGIGILGDTLYVSDGGAGRVTFFSLGGQVLGTLRLLPHGLGERYFPLTPRWLAADGNALVLPGFLPPTTRAEADSPLLFLHIDRSGEIVDTAAFVEWPSEQQIELRSPIGSAVISQPFSGALLPAVSADGSRVAVAGFPSERRGAGATFHVTVLRSTRDTVWSHLFAYEPIPISAPMVDSMVAATAGSLNKEAFPDLADAERQIRQGISVPDYFAPVSGGVFAEDGELWLSREDIPGEDLRWTVLDSAGAPVAEINLPRELSVRFIRSDTLWGVEIDTLDVPYVVRYVITR